MFKKKRLIVKTYRGHEIEANEKYLVDKRKMRKCGYVPIDEVYEKGRWGILAFLVALLLCIILIGIVVFVFMLIVKPRGKLEVAYELEQEGAADLRTTKTCPMCAEEVKPAAQVCRFCNHVFSGSEEDDAGYLPRDADDAQPARFTKKEPRLSRWR